MVYLNQNHLKILFTINSIEYTIKTRYVLFKQIIFIVYFVNIHSFWIYSCSMFEKSETGATEDWVSWETIKTRLNHSTGEKVNCIKPYHSGCDRPDMTLLWEIRPQWSTLIVLSLLMNLKNVKVYSQVSCQGIQKQEVVFGLSRTYILEKLLTFWNWELSCINLKPDIEKVLLPAGSLCQMCLFVLVQELGEVAVILNPPYFTQMFSNLQYLFNIAWLSHKYRVLIH